MSAGRRRIQPSLVFVVIAVLGAAWWAFASRDDHDYSRPAPVTFDEAQLAPLDQQERAFLLWLADTEPEWDGLSVAVADFNGSAEQRDIRNLERSCRRITDAAELLDGRLPAPHPEADGSLRRALAAYAAGGDACRAAARGEAGSIDAMGAAFDEGDEAFAAAARHIPEVPCPDGTTTLGLEPCG